MKFNDLTKQNKLLVRMFQFERANADNTQCFNIDYEGADAIAEGISKNRKSLKTMLGTLCDYGYVSRRDYASCLEEFNDYYLTENGTNHANYLISQLEDVDDPYETSDDNDDEVATASNNASIADDYVKMAQNFADIAAKMANSVVNGFNASNNLEQKTNEQESIISNLRARLATVYAELDAKNKRIEQLEASIDKLAKNFNDMRDWALAMKNGK